MGPQQLYVQYVDAGLVPVQDVLQPLFSFFLHCGTLRGQHILDGALPHHQTEGGLGGVLQRPAVGLARRNVPGVLSGVVHLEQKAPQVLDVVLDHHLHVDDVQVAADHQPFQGDGHVGNSLVSAGAEPQLHASGLGYFPPVLLAYGSGPPPVESRLSDYSRHLNTGRKSHPADLAETPLRHLLAGADPVDACANPNNHDEADDHDDQRADTAAAKAPRKPAEAGAKGGQDLLEVYFRLSRSSRRIHNVASLYVFISERAKLGIESVA